MEPYESKLTQFLDSLVDTGACPGLVAGVCSDQEVLYSYSTGHQQLIPKKLPMALGSLFDVASLTKVMATTMVTSVLRDQNEISYDKTLGYYFENPGNFKDATVQQILTHTAGFIAEQRLDTLLDDSSQAIEYILGTLPIAPAGMNYTYSCFGYIVLGRILEQITGKPLDRLAQELVFEPLGLHHTLFNPLSAGYTEEKLAATEYDEARHNLYIGVVHDENARFLGGIAGNAGLFTCLGDAMQFCQMLLRDGQGPNGRFLSHERIVEFSTDYTKGLDTARGIGFLLGDRGNTPAGSNAGVGNFGHTGFTGTSLWVSPSRKLAAVLLTNRVHPSRKNTALISLRKAFHTLAFSPQ